MTESRMFKRAEAVCPDFKSSNVSNEKAEKVLNPPQNPVARKSRMLLFSFMVSNAQAINMPIKRELMQLLTSVPMGKEVVSHLRDNSFIP